MKNTFIKSLETSATSTFSTVEASEIAVASKILRIRHWLLPLAALAMLCLTVPLTPAVDTTPQFDYPIERFAHHLSHAINSIWVGIGLIALVLPSMWDYWKYHKSPIWAWRVLDALILDFLFVDAFGKNILTGLSRPNLHPSAAHPLQAGFPSGHATMAFIMAYLIWQRYPKLGAIWYLMAILISWSRIEVHAHFPYQVVAGALLGTALGALIVSRQTGVLFPRIFWSEEQLRRAQI